MLRVFHMLTTFIFITNVFIVNVAPLFIDDRIKAPIKVGYFAPGLIS